MPKPSGYSSDPKLRNRLREFLDSPETTIPTDSNAYSYLLQVYPEYKRKPQNVLQKEISRVLSYLKEQRNTPISPLTIEEDVDTNTNYADSETPKSPVTPAVERIDEDSRPMKRRKKSTSLAPMNLNDNIRYSYETLDKPTKKKSNKNNSSKNNTLSDEEDNVDLDAKTWSRPSERYSDLAGIEPILQDLRELIEYPLSHPEIYRHLGIIPPRGILLHGPPGCGKTLLANAIAGEIGVPLIKISAPEIVSGMSGESEEKLRKLFDDAIALSPSIMFIDEIDAITQKRDSSTKGMERRIVAQLQTCMDSLNTNDMIDKPVIIIGATSRPDTLDTALRRAGRFDREICLGIPDEEAREKILRLLASKMKLDGDFNFTELAQKTPGYVGADLAALTKEAAIVCVNRIFKEILLPSKQIEEIPVNNAVTNAIVNETNNAINNEELKQESNKDDDVVMNTTDISDSIPVSSTLIQDIKTSNTIEDRCRVSEELRNTDQLTEEQLNKLSITMNDFLLALPKVQPSAKREGFATIPNTTWDDIGALDQVREEIRLSVVEPIRNPHIFKRMGLSMPAGVLLYGPPGCGKTLLAKAVSNESRANFISVKGPELLNKYVGESEKAVRQVFERARASSPCVVFFDEIDALVPRRGSDGGSSGVSERMVNMLLTELDGLEERKQVFVIAATNRPDIIDPAMLRPGRLDKLLLVPLPTPEDRCSILKTVTKHTPLEPSIDLDRIARDIRCNGFTGADLSNLVREATLFALRPALLSGQTEPSMVTFDNFNDALNKIKPSISKEDLEKYNTPPHANN